VRGRPATTAPAGSRGCRPARPRRAASSRGRAALRARSFLVVLDVIVARLGVVLGIDVRGSGVVAGVVRAVGGVFRTGELGRDRGICLGERVGEIAKDVGRVVELDELFGAGEAPPLPL